MSDIVPPAGCKHPAEYRYYHTHKSDPDFKQRQAEYRRQYYLNNKKKLDQKSKEWRQNNKAYSNQQTKKKRLERKLRIIEKMGGQCADCKQIFPPYLYDLHHLDGSTKTENVGTLMRSNWNKKLEQELEKCILLCCHCHRTRHFKQEE